MGQERVKWEPESDERAGPVSAQSVKWEWLESDKRAGPVSARSVKWEWLEREEKRRVGQERVMRGLV